MRLLIGLVIAFGVFGAEKTSIPVLSTEDANVVLKIQREQYKTWGNIQKLQADLKEMTEQLVKLNQEATKTIEDFKTKYNCKECTLGEDLKWVKQETAKVTK